MYLQIISYILHDEIPKVLIPFLTSRVEQHLSPVRPAALALRCRKWWLGYGFATKLRCALARLRLIKTELKKTGIEFETEVAPLL